MSFLTDAAKYYKAEPHQIAAWEALEAQLPVYILEDFKAAYRAAPAAPVAPKASLITTEIFSQLTGYSAELFTQQEADDCNRLLEVTGFAEDLECTRMLMANLLHETGNMRWMKELADGWAYEGRTDLGNTQPGDGPRFKGAGVLMLTGRYNYTRLSKALRDPRVLEGCDYVVRTYPFTSAETWIRENDLLRIAKTKGFDDVCYRINGGWNGYEDRKAKYKICREVL